MANIEYIRNMTTWATFSDLAGKWSQQSPAMPAANPDVCIVRGISFLGPANVEKTYMIWSNLTNDYIGSFNATCTTSQSPDFHVMLNSPVPNALTFQLHVIDTLANAARLDMLVNGNIVIQLEFVKYKDVVLHA